MLNFLAGYRTYLSAIVIIAHQILKANDIDVPSEKLSIGLDVLLGILVVVFRKLANKEAK